MATGLLALLDDIATLTGLAGKKTSGIVGDDLALSAKGLSGVDPKREFKIVLQVAKGSAKNKAILIPAALALSAFAPWAITPLLMAGGAFLCYEGMEKIVHNIKHKKDKKHGHVDAKAEVVQTEEQKVKGAIKTDFILSAEIVVVALGVMAAAPLVTQAATLCAIGAAMTIGVYGLVAGLVKLDDLGLHMASRKGDGFFAKLGRGMGRGILAGVPPLMKTIGFVGTAAMFAVGGGIIAHGIPAAHHAIDAVVHALPSVPVLGTVVEMVLTVVGGMVTGLLAIPAVQALKKPVGACVRAVKSVLPKKKVKTKAVAANENAPAPAAEITAPSKLDVASKPTDAFNAANENKPAAETPQPQTKPNPNSPAA